MKSNKVKLRGRLRKSLYWPMFMTILLICMNVVIYMDDILSGVMFSIFTAIYFVVSLIVYVRNKPVLVNELINFATQYGTVQRQLLNEFEIPYALLDYNAKILWVNEQFTELTGKDKKYHKSITTIFPSLTKEFLQKNEGSESVGLKLKDQDFRVSLKRIYFEELNSVDSLVTLDESNEYLTAVYLFDETEKNRYMRENQEQKMVAGLVYIDNYDEALDSIEDVKKIVFDADYLVLGLGDVYLGAPVATPVDPRHRMVTTKYNPARPWTPENAVGIGGAYLCVYGMEGPGGYQFVGRTIQMWNPLKETEYFKHGKPWLLDFFDQIRFYPVSAEEILKDSLKILSI